MNFRSGIMKQWDSSFLRYAREHQKRRMNLTSRIRCFWILLCASFLMAVANLGISAVFHHERLNNRNIESTTIPVSSRRVQSTRKMVPPDHNNLEPIPRPPLQSIVQGWNVTGDPSWLLQFSIIGFPKSGTSTLMFHLRKHPEVHIFKDERCELAYNQQVRLIEDMYRQFPPATETKQFVRGIKCPQDLESPKLSMRNYQKYFSTTDFIVGIRHPVLWFESFYNFRIHNQFEMPPAEKLIGICRRGWGNVCTARGNFHLFLSNLGKTNMTTDDNERKLVDAAFWTSIHPVATTRRVFLYEISQLSDPNEHRGLRFRIDLQQFLHLKQPIEPFIWFKPGMNHTEERALEVVNTRKIDICEEKYNKLRSVLMHQSKQAAEWIRTFFLHGEGVVASSPLYFSKTILKAWEVDPCLERTKFKR